MVSQSILIGIAVGVFFAGIGIGYAAFQSTATPMMMTSQQMQQMMSDPNMMNQWHQTMMNDPQAMNSWMNTMMNDPQAMTQMHNLMMNNPQYMGQMMSPMMNNWMSDPQTQQQMYGMMLQHNQFMQGMMNNTQFQNQWMPHMMNNWNGTMGSGMMMGNMMGSPITQQSDVVTTINNIEKILDQVSSNYRNGNQDTAFSLATNAYLENYEYIEGAIAQKDRPLMEKIELMMRVDLRNMIKNDESSDAVDEKIASIKSNLVTAKLLFQ